MQPTETAASAPAHATWITEAEISIRLLTRSHLSVDLRCLRSPRSLLACPLASKRRSDPIIPPTVVQVEAVALTEYAPTVRLTGEIRARG